MERQDATGFIGLGIMGGAMVQRLLAAGFPVHVHARNPDQAAAALASGAVWADDIPTLASQCRQVFTIVGGPADVEALYLGNDGLIAHSRPGSYLVDMTTSSPDLARQIASAAAAVGVRMLDAPVTGGEPGARAGTLSFIVGGDPETLAAVRPQLEAMGRRIFRIGAAGAGQAAKASNQIAVAGIMLGLAEALYFAESSGIPAASVLEVLKSGTAGGPLLERLGPKMVAGDTQASFSVDHFIKDLGIALDALGGARLPAAELCQQLYRDLAEQNGGQLGIQTLIERYRQPSRAKPR